MVVMNTDIYHIILLAISLWNWRKTNDWFACDLYVWYSCNPVLYIKTVHHTKYEPHDNNDVGLLNQIYDNNKELLYFLYIFKLYLLKISCIIQL